MAESVKDDAPITVGEARQLHAEAESAIKALVEKGGEDLNDLTPEDIDSLNEWTEIRDEAAGFLKSLPAVKAADKMHFAPRGQIARPALGRTAPGKGEDVKADEGDTKAHAEPKGSNESEAEKFALAGPFKSLGHFAFEVRRAGRDARNGIAAKGVMGEWVNRLSSYGAEFKAHALGDADPDTKALASGLSEFSDADGAIMVPIQESQSLWQRAIADDDLLSRMQTIPLSGNSLRVKAVQDASRANGSRFGGIRGNWLSEAAQITNTKPSFRYIECRLNKAAVQVAITEELLEDAPAFNSMLGAMAADELNFLVKDAVIAGTGVGMPLGLTNSGAKIVQAAVSGQGANTIVAQNIDEMWARRANPSGANYIWLGNQEIEPQLATLRYAVTNTAATWLYLPAGGITNSPVPQLKGKPVLFIEQASALGTEGDLILFDPTQYLFCVKSSGIRSAASMHLRFDYDEQVFKFVLRVDGRPYWDSALTRYKGGNTLSPIVTLNSTRT